MSTRDDIVLVDCTVFDGAASVTDQGVWISADGTIRAVGHVDDVLTEARGARFVDLAGDYVLPGLVNMHVHLGLGLPGDLADSVHRSNLAELVLLMADSARRTLRSGVTTVRLVGESRYADFALRKAINAGAVDGPRIFTAGHALCCTGGHGWDADALEADGADGFRRATRQQIRAGADLIKVCISGGIAGEHERIDTPQLGDDEMAAVIGVAHDWDRKVTAHAGPSEAIRRAIELGLDCVEHGYELTPEVTRLMAERDVWYVPTIVVSRCKEFFEANRVPTWMIDRALAAGPRHWESLQNAIRDGVPMALGSDMPPHAPFDGTTATVRELEFMVEAGMPTLAALRAATSRPAEWLGAQDRIGAVEAGKQADLIVLRADPTRDISALRTLHLVMKGGAVYRDDNGLTAGKDR
ncbi:metal-dependent hydrolase family protein [Actinocrispum wychmicini]|uniref:Imidazolonepropionase-like amidohydrolase n=1 Tax=Actinocrispum wychmicini TaxID=1213861 RepID=A0A4R2IKU6_9PSEU|nr:amidohydrolase family protein [Actinocrispum wychmicini]TCO45267.1 imidazolonepropionase-like amidohydrolase [Actinocrispum wychmicini]